MIKKNVKLMTTLALVLSLSIGMVTANAATQATTPNNAQKIEHKTCKHNKHQGSVYSILKNNLGFTDVQINAARSSGKTAFDLAKEKGKTPNQLKAMVIDAGSKRIDGEVTNGKITKERADTVKTNLKTKMQNWDGNLKHKDHEKKVK